MDDDVFLQHPVQSLRSLNGILSLFARASGYKVNEKAILKDLRVSEKEKRLISMNCKVNWKQEDIRYLGVKISLSVTKVYLIDINLIPTVNWMQSQFNK